MSSISRVKAELLWTDTSIPLTCSVSISRIDRWCVYYRLQELMIPCQCFPDGSLQVEVQSSTVAWLVWRVVQQFTASRSDRLNWLEQCWDAN